MSTAPPITTSTGRSRIPQTAALYSHAFRTDPVILYMLSNLSPAKQQSYIGTYYTALMTAAALNGAIFTETGGFTAACVTIPPGRRVDNPWTLLQAGVLGVLWNLGLGGCWRMLGEYEPLTEAAKRKAFARQKSGRGYYYVFHIAASEEFRGRGLSSALIRDVQDRAKEEGVPVWLEATTEYSWKLYGKLGFETVERMVLGEGRVGADGREKKGGEGVPIWGMVWWPEKTKDREGGS